VGKEGYCAEIFRSIQGEGLYTGLLQVFVRTAGCSLSCAYCDTAFARQRVGTCRIRTGERSLTLQNPVSAGTVAREVAALAVDVPGLHSISITGGEPLEQPAFVAALAARLRALALPLYLETNGLREEAAERIAPLVDIVSLDIKLPSLCGGGDLFPVYERVLPVFAGRRLFCKIVVAEGYSPREFEDAARMVARFGEDIPLVIQPAHPAGACRPAAPGDLLACHREASRVLRQVRVIPQCHRILSLP